VNNNVFFICDNRLCLSKNNDFIPDEEPVFILRARDKQALSTIRVYQSTLRPAGEEWKIIQNVIEEFTLFAGLNCLRMGNPSEVY